MRSTTPATGLLALYMFLSVPALVAAQTSFGVEGPERPPVLTQLAQPAPTSHACLRNVLNELGWRLDGASSLGPCNAPKVAPHTRDTLVSAGDGELSTLVALLHAPASHCGFSLRVGEATRRAVDRLIANEGFRFSALQTGWIGFGIGGAQRDGWESIRSFGRGFRPLTTPSAAIEGVYSGTVRAECGVGRQLAQYATFYELFGSRGFDTAFTRDEIVIGTFNQLLTTDSVLLGTAAGEFIRDGLGRETAQQGREAWLGLPGFIVHAFERSKLDDVNNQAENFVVYRVSEAAADALRRHGGFEHYNRQNRELWRLARSAELNAQRVFERLLFDRDETLRGVMPSATRDILEQMDAILDDPFYRGFEIYVHRRGVKPVAYHLARLLDRNPRTPFRIELTLHNLHTTIYQRWLAQRLAACEATAGAATPQP